jgi:hypothetical protein
VIAGSDGGVFISYDGGKTCDHLANLPLGEVYALTVDMAEPYNIYAGLQDHESWKGPSNGWSGSVGLEDWTTVGVGDGMYNQVDPTDNRRVYNTQEFGRHARFDQKTRERKTIAPTRPQGQPLLRFNWVAPLRLSPHDPRLAVTANEPNGITFVYYLKDQTQEKATLTVADADGKTIRTLDGATKAGLNRVVWSLGAGPGQFGGSRLSGATQSAVAPGEYTVTLQVGGKHLTQKARVLAARTP